MLDPASIEIASLLLAPGGRENVRALRLGDADRRQPDPSRRGMDQHAFAGLEAGKRHERIVRRRKGDRNRGGRGERQPAGDREKSCRQRQRRWTRDIRASPRPRAGRSNRGPRLRRPPKRCRRIRSRAAARPAPPPHPAGAARSRPSRRGNSVRPHAPRSPPRRLAARAGRCRRARGSRSTPARSWRRGRPACASSGPTGGAATATSPRRPAPAVSRNARRRAGRFPFRRCPPRSRPAGRRRRSPRGRGRRESAGSPDARWRACAGSRSFRHGETIHGGPTAAAGPAPPAVATHSRGLAGSIANACTKAATPSMADAGCANQAGRRRAARRLVERPEMNDVSGALLHRGERTAQARGARRRFITVFGDPRVATAIEDERRPAAAGGDRSRERLPHPATIGQDQPESGKLAGLLPTMPRPAPEGLPNVPDKGRSNHPLVCCPSGRREDNADRRSRPPAGRRHR